MSEPIIFYDFDGNASPEKAWNMNCWKARFALNIKGVPYKTVWLEYPDVERESKKVSIPPNGKRPDGSDLYTLPAIVDPSSGTAISDSQKIAHYLDEHYSSKDTPRLFPPGSRALQLSFRDAVTQRVYNNALKILLYPSTLQLNEASQAVVFPKHSKTLGSPLGDLAPAGSEKQAALTNAAIDGLSTIGTWIDANETEGPFIMGERPCFADCDLAALLMWAKIIAGEGDWSFWSTIARAEGGRWERYLDAFDEWSTVH